MASEAAVEKRANLLASRVHWSHMELLESHGNSSQDSVREWLTTAVSEEDAKHVLPRDSAEPLRRNPSSEDDLALGVEASLYGKQGLRTVQEFLRWTRSRPALSRWSSFNSAASGHSTPLSVMDVLNLWNDDPEEVLLDLGFGCDEPDISGRIPARFINHQSQARGINLQVFLEAQKNRLDLENPDVSNRFRQLEVLQQVTSAFSSLVGASSSSALGAQRLMKDLPAEARERRRRMGMLFRRASKKSLSQIPSSSTQDQTTQATASPSAAPQPLQPPASPGDTKALVKRVKPGLQDTVCLSPLAEELGPGPDTQEASSITQDSALRLGPLKEGHPLSPNTALERRRSPGQARESFEMEEIHSFDDSSIAGSFTAGAENTVWGVNRTNSCQSDSSGFLEEPFIPSLSQQTSPGSELIKALSVLSGDSTDSNTTVREASSAPPTPTSPSVLPFSSSTCNTETALFSSPSFPPECSLVSPTSPDSASESQEETPPDHDLAQPPSDPPASFSLLVFDSPPPHSSSTDVEDTAHCHSSSPTTSFHAGPMFSPQPPSLVEQPEQMKIENVPLHSLSSFSTELEDKTSPSMSLPPLSPSPPSSPACCSSFLASIAKSFPQTDFPSGSPKNTQTERSEASPHPSLSLNLECKAGASSTLPPPTLTPSPDSNCCNPSFRSPEDSQTERNEVSPLSSLSPDSDGIGMSHPHIKTQIKEEEELLLPPSLSHSSDLSEEDPTFSSTPNKSEEDLSKLSCLCSTSSSSSEIDQCSVLASPPSAFPDPDDLTDQVVRGIPDSTEWSVTQQDRPCHHDHNTESAPDSSVQHVIEGKTEQLALDPDDDLQRDGRKEGEPERQGETLRDTVQTQGAVVYMSDADCSAVMPEDSRSASVAETETEPQPQIQFFGLNETESEEQKRSSVSHDEVPEMVQNGRTESEPKVSGPVQIESLDLVFETSVDGSEGDGEYGDVDAICRELDSDGYVYWAEPIQVCTPSPVLEESGSFDTLETSLGTSVSPTGPTTPDSPTSAALFMSESASSDILPSLTPAPSSSTALADLNSPGRSRSGRSVSVQMPSSLCSHSVSHIVHRKDVPYITDSKPTIPPSVLTLDTSTPLRAVRSWTDLKIQQSALTKKSQYRGLHPLNNQVTISETTRRPALIFSSSPSFPLLSKDWQSCDSFPGSAGSFRSKSVSLDTGLWPDDKVDRGDDEDEEKRWEGDLMTNFACCCSCDHRCTCCTQNSHGKQDTVGNLTYSLDELEGMMICLRQFRVVLNNMEEHLSNDQASVYSALSDHDREEIQEIAELRKAVKQEAGELELQLDALANHYDDSFKMKMHRLLDEQSLLCSQLRLCPPGATPVSSGPAHRTVATQCCLLPWLPLTDMPSGYLPSSGTWDLESSRHSLSGSEGVCEGLGCSPTKTDKLDFVGFLQRLKESLRHSANTESAE
ncbi:mucin-12 [Myripristis murdjan]|uniref:mucin-12 n=1 Tax=Myripristis murdjan TaxID=586833 RepID=UPI001175DFBB|nr:protein ITPRID1 [Myripristis murdjan]